MTTRLSDLLERLRPTGTPGAATEGAGQREADERQREIADVAAVLASFQAEADAIVADARHRAADIHRQGLDEARRIDGRVPDRVASAVGSLERHNNDDATVEQRRIMERATADAERVRQSSDARISHIANAATALVWAAVQPEATVSTSTTAPSTGPVNRVAAGWVAPTTRGCALIRRRLGAQGAADLAASPTWADARHELSQTVCGHDLPLDADRRTA